jgi:hypothetical protein
MPNYLPSLKNKFVKKMFAVNMVINYFSVKMKKAKKCKKRLHALRVYNVCIYMV